MRSLLFVATLIAPVLAHPVYVGCDLKVRNAGKNVMTTTDKIMGAAPVTKDDLVTLSNDKFLGGTYITITLHADFQNGFAHASDGTFTAAEFSAAKDANAAACTSPATIKYQHPAPAAATPAIFWTAPADVSSISEVTLSFGANKGYGVINRKEIKITRDAEAAGGWTAAPAGTTAAPSGTQAPGTQGTAGGATQVGVTLAFGIAIGVLLTRAN